MGDSVLADKQYKDGYQVLEGGDYLVHTEGTKYKGKHMVIRAADGDHRRIPQPGSCKPPSPAAWRK